MNLKSDLRVQTPEGVVFAFTLAGPVSRCCAWCIDLAAIVALQICVAKLAMIFSLASLDLATGVQILSFFVVTMGYGAICEGMWRGQTLGKRAMRLRVIDVRGLQLEIHQVLLRNLLRSVDLLPGFYLVGGVSCFFSQKAQRLGDLAAGTVVVRERRPPEPDVAQLIGGKYNSLRQHPHLAARLRQRIEPEEAQIALQALLRRENFEATPRLELFAELAKRFRALVVFPPETVESISDEQYVRNVVDLLFVNKPGGAAPRPEHQLVGQLQKAP